MTNRGVSTWSPYKVCEKLIFSGRQRQGLRPWGWPRPGFRQMPLPRADHPRPLAAQGSRLPPVLTHPFLGCSAQPSIVLCRVKVRGHPPCVTPERSRRGRIGYGTPSECRPDSTETQPRPSPLEMESIYLVCYSLECVPAYHPRAAFPGRGGFLLARAGSSWRQQSFFFTARSRGHAWASAANNVTSMVYGGRGRAGERTTAPRCPQ